jgi:hypothetical protein
MFKSSNKYVKFLISPLNNAHLAEQYIACIAGGIRGHERMGS